MAIGIRRKKKGLFGSQQPAQPAMGMMQPGLGADTPQEQSQGLGTRLLGEGWEGKAAALGSALMGNSNAIPQYQAQQQGLQQQQMQAQQAAQQAQLQRAQELADFETKEGIKAEYRAPTAMQRNFQSYQDMTPEQQADFDRFNPVIVQGPMGPTAVSRSSLGGNAAPRVGAIEDGFMFKGGDPADQRNWEPIPAQRSHTPQTQNRMSAMGGESTESYMRRMGY